MKKLILIVMLLGAIAGLRAQGEGIGVGIILGEPTGISAKMWISPQSAIDAAVAWSFVDGSYFHIHADYLLHSFDLINVEKGQLPLYYGIGGKIKFNSRTEVGVRIPVGLAYLFEGAPFDIFLEVVPGLQLSPETAFDIDGALGFRFYF